MQGEDRCQSRCDVVAAETPFLSYRRYLEDRYGCTVYRVAVDGGFSCPHRRNGRTGTGCSFCDERGSLAPYQQTVGEGLPVREVNRLVAAQIDRGVAFLRNRYRAEAFILYFQAFTGTYAPVPHLRQLYDAALDRCEFLELVVSTRPDALGSEVVQLLRSYRTDRREVWVEIGLQSAHDTTLRRLGRGHTYTDFVEAYRRVKAAHLKVAVHLMFGLPGEDDRQMMQTVERVAALRPDGVKIHDLQLSRSAPLFAEYLRGELVISSRARHVGRVADALERLPQDTVIERLTCDMPDHVRAAPRRVMPKAELYRRVAEEMTRRRTRQGSYFNGERSPQ